MKSPESSFGDCTRGWLYPKGKTPGLTQSRGGAIYDPKSGAARLRGVSETSGSSGRRAPVPSNHVGVAARNCPALLARRQQRRPSHRVRRGSTRRMDFREPGRRRPHADGKCCQDHPYIHNDFFIFHNGDSRIAPRHLVYAVNRLGAIARFGTGADTFGLPASAAFRFPGNSTGLLCVTTAPD